MITLGELKVEDQNAKTNTRGRKFRSMEFKQRVLTDMRQSNMSLTEAAKKYGLPAGTVGTWSAKHPKIGRGSGNGNGVSLNGFHAPKAEASPSAKSVKQTVILALVEHLLGLIKE